METIGINSETPNPELRKTLNPKLPKFNNGSTERP